MSESTAPGASIPIAAVPNLRDLGGWPTTHGTVARGRLFRSAEFSDLAGDDLAAFAQLGIATVYDLRTRAERAAAANVVPAGVGYEVIDVLADADNQGPAMLMRVAADPRAAEEALGGGKAQALFEGAYRDLVLLPSAQQGYRRFLAELSDGAHLPALFHCTTGKDRTGWAAATVLLLLGVSQDDVTQEFLLTNEQLAPAVEPIKQQFAALGGDPALLDPVLGVRREYLEAALAAMHEAFGDVEGYVTTGLGLEPGAVDRLREALTVR
jgi:protein-tyrosine phosphatase